MRVLLLHLGDVLGLGLCDSGTKCGAIASVRIVLNYHHHNKIGRCMKLVVTSNKKELTKIKINKITFLVFVCTSEFLSRPCVCVCRLTADTRARLFNRQTRTAINIELENKMLIESYSVNV